MEKHKCIQNDDVEKLKRIIFGNGQKGLIEKFAIMDTNINHVSEALEDNATAVRALLQFMNETNAVHKKEISMKAQLRWIVGICVSIILALIGLLFTL